MFQSPTIKVRRENSPGPYSTRPYAAAASKDAAAPAIRTPDALAETVRPPMAKKPAETDPLQALAPARSGARLAASSSSPRAAAEPTLEDVPSDVEGPVPSAQSLASRMTPLDDKSGVASFLLHVPSSKIGEPAQTFHITVLGEEAADLAALSEADKNAYLSDMATHLTGAIELVQSHTGKQSFSSITFEGRLDDKTLAKAHVQTGTETVVIGGDSKEKLKGTEKSFSQELDTLMGRLRDSLRARHLRNQKKIVVKPNGPAQGGANGLPPEPRGAGPKAKL